MDGTRSYNSIRTSLAFIAPPHGAGRIPAGERADTFAGPSCRADCSRRHPDPVDQQQPSRRELQMGARFEKWAMPADAASVRVARRRVVRVIRAEGWDDRRVDEVAL